MRYIEFVLRESAIQVQYKFRQVSHGHHEVQALLP
jgi:hypothetical protein